MNSLSGQKINKKIVNLYDAIAQMTLTDIFRIFPPTAPLYAIFLSAHETFSRVNHILNHYASLNDSRRLKSYLVFFFLTYWYENINKTKTEKKSQIHEN